MKPLSIILVVVLFCSVSEIQTDTIKIQSHGHKFKISISFLVQPSGRSYDYRITQDSLRLNFNCNQVNCKDTMLYTTKLEMAKAEKYYSLVKNLKIDTLQNFYQGRGLDGLSTLVSIQGDSLIEKSVLTEHSFRHPIIKILVDETNNLIGNDNFEFKGY